VTRVFVTGFHNTPLPNSSCVVAAAATSPIFRRNFWSNSNLLQEFTSSSDKDKDGGGIERETQNEIARMSAAAAAASATSTPRQICRTLHSKWEDFHLGPGFVSVVSGLPKDFGAATFRRGQFGDDAWFIARNSNADVIGEIST